MTTNERFLSVLHRITSCRHLATVNITIWNGRIEVRHTVFDEMYDTVNKAFRKRLEEQE